MKLVCIRHRLEREARLVGFAGELLDEGNAEARRMEEQKEKPEQQESQEKKEVTDQDLEALVSRSVEKQNAATQDVIDLKDEQQKNAVLARNLERKAAQPVQAPEATVRVPDAEATAKARRVEKTTDEIAGTARAIMAPGTPDHDGVDGPAPQYKEVDVGGGQVELAQEGTKPEAAPQSVAAQTNEEQAEEQTVTAADSAEKRARNEQPAGPDAAVERPETA